MKPTLSIVIVSYNTRQLTAEAIKSVYAETKKTDFELIVLDNLSSDGSAEYIEEQFPEVKLIKSEENLGFAGGNNKAIEIATGEYVLLLNPDTVVLDRAIDILMDFAESQPQAGIWGGRTLFADGTLNSTCCHHRMTLWNQVCTATGLSSLFKNTTLFGGEHYGSWQRDNVRKVDIVSGCYLLTRLETWRHLGGFDLKYFMYGEEADLCLRAKKIGCSPMMTPDSTIIHYGGASEKVRADKMVNLLAAKMELILTHWPAWQTSLGKLLFYVRIYTRIAGFKLFSVIQPSRDKYRDSLEVWKTILERSPEWEKGYSGRIKCKESVS
jgi:GT2 family glycosyltransferase